MAADAGAIDTEIVYLARDEKYATEKPFTMAFSVDDVPEAAVDNHIWEAHPVQIGNARDGINPELDTHGFQFVPWETALERADFEFDEIIITRYYAELAKLVKAHFPRYKKVAFFNYAIRRRDARYPAAKGAETEAAQPFRFAHVDYTETGAKLKLQESLGTGAEERLKNKCDVLNIWRLLNDSPTKDWPLALCDYRSIDADRDLIANDIVYQTGLGEDCFLHYNREHRWWYLADQSPKETIIFRNVCIADSAMARGFHCAFANPAPDGQDVLRESIEVRLAAFY